MIEIKEILLKIGEKIGEFFCSITLESSDILAIVFILPFSPLLYLLTIVEEIIRRQ